MGGEETQEGPYYNSDTLDDGRIIAPGYVNCLICVIHMYEHTCTIAAAATASRFVNLFVRFSAAASFSLRLSW